jgi:uncharacterized DUF497 family protein
VATVVSGDFQWDDTKAAANRAKHGVSFDEAAVALASDANEVAFEDVDDSSRTRSLVMSPMVRILLVVTTDARARTRIITARKATPHERRTYETR